MHLRLLAGDRVVAEWDRAVRVESFGRVVIEFDVRMPARSGRYRAVAELRRSEREPVRSRREFEVLTEADLEAML